MITLTNENWYYLHLEDGSGGVVIVPPETTVTLPDYFSKYANKFVRDTVPGTIPTDAISVGTTVSVYTNSRLDGEIGVVVDKDEYNYKVEFGTEGQIWFPYSEVYETFAIPLSLSASMSGVGTITTQLTVDFNFAVSIDGNATTETAFSILHDLGTDIVTTSDVACEFNPFVAINDFVSYFPMNSLIGEGVTWGTDPTEVDGVYNGALAAPNGPYGTAAAVSTSTGGLSVSFWMKLTSQNSTIQQVFLHESGLEMYIHGGASFKTIYFRRRHNSDWMYRKYATFASHPDIVGGEWVHIAICADDVLTTAGSLKVYKNGSEIALGGSANSNGTIDETGNLSFFATEGGGNKTNSTLDEFMIWDRELSSTEVSDLYQWYLDQQDITTGLTHYWRPATTLDPTDTVGTLDGTDTGTVTYDSEGAAFGTGSNYTDLGTYQPTSTDITISIWAKADSAMTTHAYGGWLINNRGSTFSEANWSIYYDKPTGNWITDVVCGSTQYAASAGAVSFGNWQHIVMTVDTAADVITSYLNGSQQNQTSFAGQTPNNGSRAFVIGGAAWSPTGSSTKYHGNYNDCRIYEGVVLSQIEVAALYDWYLDQNIDLYLSHYWRPSTNLDSTDTIEGPSAIDGIDNGTVNYSADGADFGTADANYTRTGAFTPLSTTVSMSIWAKPDVTSMNLNSGGGLLFSHRGSSANTLMYHIYYAKSVGKWQIVVGFTDNTFGGVTSDDTVTHDTWVNIGFVYTPSLLTMYINGVAQADTLTITKTPVSSAREFAIGTASYALGDAGTKYHGKYDDFRVYYGRELTPAEMLEIYNLGRGA